MKTKKFIAALASSLFTVSGILNTLGTPVFAEATSPKFYVDITYETEDTIRADIILENVPNFSNGGFIVQFDDGWTPVYDEFDEPYFSKNNCTSSSAVALVVTNPQSTPQVYGIAFILRHDTNCNGRFLSLYFNKSNTYSSDNSNINVGFAPQSALNTSNNNCVLSGENPDSLVLPEITQTNEYMIGDANGDNRVNSIDASAVLSGLSTAGVYNINPKVIENNYHTYFPNALAPAAPDADKSGLINEDDAMAILDYYGNSMTIENYEGQIGSMDIYEYYNN